VDNPEFHRELVGGRFSLPSLNDEVEEDWIPDDGSEEIDEFNDGSDVPMDAVVNLILMGNSGDKSVENDSNGNLQSIGEAETLGDEMDAGWKGIFVVREDSGHGKGKRRKTTNKLYTSVNYAVS
jgi:hypothetical protein